ncbi:unnamed protein product [Dracunculus medinensis]|uniref:Uncharacterized protein n=1 Tax=Dracunculus medinensis TaxID=318479 RepID=A0A0N4ULZ8_DRAME|nr:unnamed protein product [Dracunculus medinensis]
MKLRKFYKESHYWSDDMDVSIRIEYQRQMKPAEANQAMLLGQNEPKLITFYTPVMPDDEAKFQSSRSLFSTKTYQP